MSGCVLGPRASRPPFLSRSRCGRDARGPRHLGSLNSRFRRTTALAMLRTSAGIARPKRRKHSMSTPAITRRIIIAVLTAFTAALAPLAVAAQPAGRPITIVVPFTPGTGPDILARVLGDEFQNRLHQPVVIDNKAGASGNIGTQFVARAAPDGLTLLMTSSPFTQNLALMKNVPYDPIRNFTPVIECGIGVMALVVHPSVPVKSTKEFVDYVKAR